MSGEGPHLQALISIFYAYKWHSQCSLQGSITSLVASDEKSHRDNQKHSSHLGELESMPHTLRMEKMLKLCLIGFYRPSLYQHTVRFLYFADLNSLICNTCIPCPYSMMT